MPAKSEEPLQKHTLLLYAGDFDKLAAFGKENNIKPATIIRHVVRKYVEHVEGSTTLPADLELMK